MNTKSLPIAFPLRAWLAVEVLFGVGAVLAVGLAPADTATNFAWPIQPVVMAAVLGAFYITSAPLFLFPLLAKRWEMIRVMILPAALFCAIQLAATFLHWDKFSIGTLPFYVWFASYLLPPPIFIAAYLWHQKRIGEEAPVWSEDQIPAWLRTTLLVLGSALALIAFVAFFFPNAIIPIFPWKLTALTARALSGWLAAVGTLMLSMRNENSRTRSRLGTPMLMLLLPALLMQMSRYANEVNWGSPVLWVGLFLIALTGLTGLILALGNWREPLS